MSIVQYRVGKGLLMVSTLSQLLLIPFLITSCDTAAELCTLQSQCPVGYFCADGRCTPQLQHDAASLEQGGRHELGGSDTRFDGMLDFDRTPNLDLQHDAPWTCIPHADDQVARSEMLFPLGVEVPYTVGSGITVDLQGALQGGRLQWDLTAAASDDHQETSVLQPLFSWAGPAFPGATYMSLLDQDLGTYGVFAVTPGALQLIGVVSEPSNQTKLSYSSPVDLLRFPITDQDSFQTEAEVSGTLNWIPMWFHESYDVRVLAVGDLQLPQLKLPVLLVRAKVVQTPVNPLLATTRVTFMFVAECYGIVARIVVDGDPGEQLGAVLATERRRLSF